MKKYRVTTYLGASQLHRTDFLLSAVNAGNKFSRMLNESCLLQRFCEDCGDYHTIRSLFYAKDGTLITPHRG